MILSLSVGRSRDAREISDASSSTPPSPLSVTLGRGSSLCRCVEHAFFLNKLLFTYAKKRKRKKKE